MFIHRQHLINRGFKYTYSKIEHTINGETKILFSI